MHGDGDDVPVAASRSQRGGLLGGGEGALIVAVAQLAFGRGQQQVPLLGTVRPSRGQPRGTRDPGPGLGELRVERQGAIEPEGIPQGLLDLPGGDPGRVDPLQHRDGVVTAADEVQGLGETVQIVDVQRADRVDLRERVGGISPPPAQVSLPSPVQLCIDVHGDTPDPGLAR